MKIYADTSFLLSLYLPDANSARAVVTMGAAASPVLLTPLGELEVSNALQLRRFRKELNSEEASAVFSNFQKDVAEGTFSLAPLPPEVYSRAIRLARKWTPRRGTRSLDILHVAAALLLGADAFYTFDGAQSQLARREKLRTL